MYRFGLLPRLDPDSIWSVDADSESGSMRQKWPIKIGRKKFLQADRFMYNRVAGDPSGREADFWRLHLLAGQHSLARQLSNFYYFSFFSEDGRPGRKL
jgi:hypothetical protein